jgi:carboxyl-terminal processing protease
MKKTIKIICYLLIASLPIFSSGSSESKKGNLDNIAPTTTLVPENQGVTENVTEEDSIQIIKDNLNMTYALYQFIDSYSIYDLDENKAFEAMASALVDSLDDKYSVYIKKDEIKEFNESNLGTYSGIGSYILKQNPKNIDMDDPETYMIKIESPFPGGPSERAGLRANDLISHIDGEAVNLFTGTESSNKLKGLSGTEVTLTVLRGTKTFDVTLTRQIITIPSTDYDIINEHIGYLRISQFLEKTDIDVSTSIIDMLDNNIDCLIIDIRNNGGGIVSAATNIANLFLTNQTIVTTQNKKTLENNTKITMAGIDTIVPMDFPLILLVNEGSASSSEILTGALKDNDRATIIGTQTYGKGVMQQIYPLGEALLKLTVAQYLTPNGDDINGVGITPNIIMSDNELSDETLDKYEEIMNDNSLSLFVDDNPDFTQANLIKFVSQYNAENVDKTFLKLLVRNEYLYRIDYEDRPKYDSVNDEYLKTAIEFLEK